MKTASQEQADTGAHPPVSSGATESQSVVPPAAVIELDNLCVSYRKPVLDGLTATVGGRCIGLLGPNGAGKTTLLNTLLGFKKPTAGSARLFGHNIGGSSGESLVGYMPERDAFIAGMTGVRFVRMMAELSGLAPRRALERAHEVLFYVGLGEARYRNLETYSLGMKQVAKLAQAIVHGPRLLFLDEPTNGLDPPARARMLQLIREIRDTGDTHIVMASHLLRDVEACCDEVLVLKDGRIATYCNLEEERRTNRRYLLLQIHGDEGAFSAALRELGCDTVEQSQRRIRVILPDGVDVPDIYALAERLSIQVRSLSFKRDSLEDIFLRAMDDAS